MRRPKKRRMRLNQLKSHPKKILKVAQKNLLNLHQPPKMLKMVMTLKIFRPYPETKT